MIAETALKISYECEYYVRAIYYVCARDTHFLIDTDEWRLNWNVLVSLRREPEFRERGMI